MNPFRISLQLNPVGVVHTKASVEEIKFDHENLEACIEIFPQYSDGLDGLEGFSHIFVLGYFDKLRPEQLNVLKVRPIHLLKKGFMIEELPLVGVFALGSPSRPNPIGLSLVELLRVNSRFLSVRGLDYFDGTPVLDIKPYKTRYDIDAFHVPEWCAKLHTKAGDF